MNDTQMDDDQKELFQIFWLIAHARWLEAHEALLKCPPDKYLWFRELVSYACAQNASVKGEV